MRLGATEFVNYFEFAGVAGLVSSIDYKFVPLWPIIKLDCGNFAC